MFNTFNFMAINHCCILGGPYYPTLPSILESRYWLHKRKVNTAKQLLSIADSGGGGGGADTGEWIYIPWSG